MKLTPEEKRARANAYNRKNRDKRNAAARRWYAKAKTLDSEAWRRHKETQRLRAPKYQEKRNEYSRRMRVEDPQRGYAYSRKHKLKVNETKAGRKKPSSCEVCGNSKAKIHFDHCHKKGMFRGWICFHCNSILGHAKDNPNHLRKLAAYLERKRAPVPEQLTLPV